jgi:hypothetical protein
VNTIGPLIIASCTLHVPESGSWVLEVEHDLPTGVPAPSGKVACLVGDTPFVGTVDPSASGVFGTRARARVVGAAEWSTALPKRDFQNPAGVTSLVVISATAAELGIPAVVAVPELIGPHFARVAGPASQVLGRSGWWVSSAGVTTVGPRPPSAPGLDFFLSEFDPLSRMAKATSLSPVMPGMIVPSLDFPAGALRVREVTQTWNADGATASLWLGDLATTTAQGPRLANAIQAMAISAMRPELLTHYAYTVVGQTPNGGYMLQSEVRGPVPDAMPVVHWPGVPGFSCKLTPGSKVLVGFRGREPVVVGFDASTPVSGTWDYLTMSLGGPLAKPTANADVIESVLTLIGKVNAMHTGSTTAPYAGIADDTAAIEAKLAAMKTKSA